MPFSQSKTCTELDRLSFTVHSIEHQCQSIPLGSFKLTPSKELRYNESYCGLSLSQSSQLSSYLHFRKPTSEDKKAMLCKFMLTAVRDDCIYEEAILESLEEDLPRGQWSIQADSSKVNVSIWGF